MLQALTRVFGSRNDRLVKNYTRLVREATDASTVSTENTSAVMRGSTPRMSSNDRVDRSTPRRSAMPT